MRVHRFLLEIHATEDVEAQQRLIPTGLAQLIACDRAAFNEFNVGPDRTIVPFPVVFVRETFQSGF